MKTILLGFRGSRIVYVSKAKTKKDAVADLLKHFGADPKNFKPAIVFHKRTSARVSRVYL